MTRLAIISDIHGNPLAAYALLELGRELNITLRRVTYDINRTIQAIVERGLPPKAGEDLRVGRR